VAVSGSDLGRDNPLEQSMRVTVLLAISLAIYALVAEFDMNLIVLPWNKRPHST
jgi:hypothetical protein